MEKKLLNESLIRRLLVGSDRLPAHEQLPATTVTAALAAENLRRRAGFALLRLENVASKPVPASEGNFPGTELGKALKHILSGVYLPALPEYLDHLREQALDVPPEYLPDLLDFLLRNTAVAERCYPLPGVRALWLVAQNPKWKTLYDWANADFFRAKADERMRLLRTTRLADPGKALSWLQTTWSEESAKQKRLFLGVLENGLSTSDLPLLELAWDDKNREVRFGALLLSAKLRVGSAYAQFRNFAARRLLDQGSFVHKMLQVTLEDFAPLVYFSPEETSAHLPGEALRLLLLTVHADDLCTDLQLPSTAALFETLDPATALSFAVEGLFLHENEACAMELMDWLAPDKAPELWFFPSFYRLICLFPEMAAHANWRSEAVKPGVLWEVLAAHEKPWPESLLPLLLQTMTMNVPRGDDGVHFQGALSKAAWYAPAISGRKALSVLPAEMRSSREMLKLEDVLVFRKLLAGSEQQAAGRAHRPTASGSGRLP